MDDCMPASIAELVAYMTYLFPFIMLAAKLSFWLGLGAVLWECSKLVRTIRGNITPVAPSRTATWAGKLRFTYPPFRKWWKLG